MIISKINLLLKSRLLKFGRKNIHQLCVSSAVIDRHKNSVKIINIIIKTDFTDKKRK